MTPHLQAFLNSTLGTEAAQALRKATERCESLSTVLGARTIVGWLGLASRWGFDGPVPGLAGSYLRFEKSEDDLFQGEVRMGKDVYKFEGVDLPHIAAGLSVALGADEPPDEDLRNADLAALGANIDLLLKTQIIKEMTSSEESSESSSESSEDLEKAGGTTAPGEAATQKPPAGPLGGGFTPPRAKQPSRNKKSFGAKLTMSQASSKCSVCGEAQFRGDLFLGCYCTKDLAKHATVESVDTDGYQITFDPAVWNREDVSLLLDIVNEGA